MLIKYVYTLLYIILSIIYEKTRRTDRTVICYITLAKSVEFYSTLLSAPVCSNHSYTQVWSDFCTLLCKFKPHKCAKVFLYTNMATRLFVGLFLKKIFFFFSIFFNPHYFLKIFLFPNFHFLNYK